MKTLDQVEARIPIDAAHTPGDGSNLFIISAPGSYYLTGNITGVNGKNGIAINADNVTLDLNGFALIGVGGSLKGITVPSAHKNLRIHNGSAQSWGNVGISCAGATNSQFDHLRVSQNSAGFACANGNVLSEINAEANTSGTGIVTNDSCTVTASTAVGNGLGGGFDTGSQCTIIGCTAVSNFIGISSRDNATIKDCTAAFNGIGILTGANCQILSNDASGNNGPGIQTQGINNRIDSNHCIFNASYGIKSSGPTADFIMRNTCFLNNGAVVTGSNANYSPNTGTYFGPLSTPGSATSAWANF